MQCNAGMVRLGYAQFGPLWHGRLGSDWLCSARLGIARQGSVSLGWYGWYGDVRVVRLCCVMKCIALKCKAH